MVSVRVPTSSSSFLRSISTCRDLCLSTSKLALLAANWASKLLRRNGTVSISIPICLIFCSRSWRMSSCSKSECTCAEVIDSAERRQSLPGWLDLIEGSNDLLWPRTYGDVFGEIDPTNDSARIDQKLGGSRNISTFRSCAGMQHVVTPNDLRFGIRKQWECVAPLLRLSPVNLRWIDTNPDDTDAACIEFGKMLLKTPQLGVA